MHPLRSVPKPSRFVGTRQSLKTGALFGALALAWEGLAVLPGRITIGRHETQYGRSSVEYTIAGTFRDVSDLALPLGGLLFIVLAVALLARRADTLRRRTLRTSLSVVLGLVGLLLWLTSSATAEFKLQRGVDATRFDIEMGASNSTIAVSNALGFLRLDRHWVPACCVGVIAAVLGSFFWRRALSWSTSRPVYVLVGFVCATLLGWGLCLLPLDPNVHVFRTLSDRHVVGEPFVNLFTGLGRSQENVRLGMRGMVAHAKYPPQPSGAGESLLGLPTYPPSAVDCTIHPMARSFPELGVEATRPGATGAHPLDAKPAQVLELLDRLSAELYEGRTTPIDLWQVMLESFRADDFHAISSAAPRELTPFVGSLYESAEKGEGSVVAVHRMWQAGARTSQGLSAYLCGMGMMPYGLSVTRDFGSLPLRCLTDVMVDAGFDTSFFFGGLSNFDAMDVFFRGHGVSDLVTRGRLPESLPTAEIGVSDRALVAHATSHVASKPADRGHYTLVMLVSNHVPYRRPDDVPPDVDERVDEIAKSPLFAGAKDDLRRLRTLAYSDHAVSELFSAIGPRLDRSIVVLGADHATSDPFVWHTTPEWNRHSAQALIPFVIVFPEALLAKLARPERARELVRALNEAFAHEPWSENDVPTLLLTLLSHGPGMRAIPPARRWHTFGGERTSPFFVPPRPEVKILGIDCVAELFGTDDQDRSLLAPEKASFVRHERDLYTSSPTLIPVAATFSRFLNGYAATCGHFPM